MEVGKYIDFHNANEVDPIFDDYSVRLYWDGSNLSTTHSFKVSGNQNVSGEIKAGRILLNDPNTTADWNNDWQCGFFDGYNIANAPEQNQWFWGLNLGHRSNSSTVKYGGQIAIKNSPTTPTLYFRSKSSGGTGTWTKVLHNTGNQSVNGDFTVDGTINAQEIQIKQDVWADHVFNEDYNLKSLTEVEEFIKKNGRLPDVPSENNVKEQGVNLAQMNKLLLQKIEELTIYSIEQKKIVDAQSKEILKIKAENKVLSQIEQRLKALESKN